MEFLTQTGAGQVLVDRVNTFNGAAAPTAGVDVQRFKAGYGVDGVYQDVSAATPLPTDTNARQRDTYTLLADGVATGTLTAFTRKDILIIEHPATATKTVKVRKVTVSGWQTTALAGVAYAKLHTGVVAGAGGTVVTPRPVVSNEPAAEVSGRTLPTTSTTVNPMVTAALGNLAATANTGWQDVTLYQWDPAGEQQPITLRAGALETLVVAMYSTVAHNFTVMVTVVLTEE